MRRLLKHNCHYDEDDNDEGDQDDYDDDIYIMMKCLSVCLSRKMITFLKACLSVCNVLWFFKVVS